MFASYTLPFVIVLLILVCDHASGIGRDGLKLVFEDKFGVGSILNSSIWNPNYPWGSTYNHRANMARRQVSINELGRLNLTAIAIRSTIIENIDTADYGLLTLDYTSGAINTNGRRTVKRGLVLVRMQVPSVTSSWPTMMLVPPDQTMPVLTMDVFDNRKNVGFAFRYTSDTGSSTSVSGVSRSVVDNSLDMHTYAIDWGFDKVTFSYDNIILRSFTQTKEIAQITEMGLIIALGVGGRSPSPNATDYPASLLIDSVEMWEAKYEGRYRLRNVNSDLVIEVEYGSIADFANVKQNNDTGVLWQQWDVHYVGNGGYKIMNVNSRKVLDDYDWQTVEGAKVLQYRFEAKDNHIWRILENDDDTVTFFNVWAQKAASFLGASKQPGAQLVLRELGDGPEQKWKMIQMK